MNKLAYCPDFKPRPTEAWLCYWWNSEKTEAGIEWFCSRPSWDYRTCETRGMRFKVEVGQDYEREEDEYPE